VLSRRQFISQTAVVTALCTAPYFTASAAAGFSPPIAVFSKVYQTLNLNFEDAAAVTAEAGLDGIDCPVRPGGEVLPERVTEDLPRYAESLRQRKLTLALLTTAITNASTPHAEQILRTAKKLGVRYYRIGFIYRQEDAVKQLRETKAQLKDLAELNRQIGLTALVQNHSPSDHIYLGGNLAELREIVSDFDPAQVGVAFDIGHALIVHGDEWHAHFEKLKSHLKVAYVKDAQRDGHWVPFGQGDVGKTGYFKLLKEMNYHAPISMHIEFDWTDQGKSKTRPALVQALKDSSRVLKQWLAEA